VRKRAQRFLRGRGIAGAPRGLYFSVHAGIDLEESVWQDVLIQDCRLFGIKAVILDPIRRYSPNVDKGPAEVRAVTAFLRKLSVEAQCSIVIVHHDVKPGREEDTRRRGHRASGGDWFAACEAPIHVEPAGKDASLVVPEDYKFSDDPESFVFRIDGKANEPVRVVAETARVTAAKAFAMEERVLAWITEHPRRSMAQIAKALGGRKADIVDCIETMAKDGRLDEVAGPRGARTFFVSGQL
jgi:hypothetical protein